MLLFDVNVYISPLRFRAKSIQVTNKKVSECFVAEVIHVYNAGFPYLASLMHDHTYPAATYCPLGDTASAVPFMVPSS